MRRALEIAKPFTWFYWFLLYDLEQLGKQSLSKTRNLGMVLYTVYSVGWLYLYLGHAAMHGWFGKGRAKQEPKDGSFCPSICLQIAFKAFISRFKWSCYRERYKKKSTTWWNKNGSTKMSLKQVSHSSLRKFPPGKQWHIHQLESKNFPTFPVTVVWDMFFSFPCRVLGCARKLVNG